MKNSSSIVRNLNNLYKTSSKILNGLSSGLTIMSKPVGGSIVTSSDMIISKISPILKKSGKVTQTINKIPKINKIKTKYNPRNYFNNNYRNIGTILSPSTNKKAKTNLKKASNKAAKNMSKKSKTTLLYNKLTQPKTVKKIGKSMQKIQKVIYNPKKNPFKKR